MSTIVIVVVIVAVILAGIGAINAPQKDNGISEEEAQGIAIVMALRDED